MHYSVLSRSVAIASLAAATCAFAQSGKVFCSNPQIDTAYHSAAGRSPAGAGTTGECSPALYGTWSSQADLNAKVAVRTGHAAAAPLLAVPANFSWYVDASQNLVQNTAAHTVIAPAGTYDLRKPDGTAISLVAQGGGNLVAQGGGNLVAQGGGNLAQRSILSAGNKKVFIVQK